MPFYRFVTIFNGKAALIIAWSGWEQDTRAGGHKGDGHFVGGH